MGFTWSEAFATGVAEIDAQHRELLDQVERLLGAIQSDPTAVGRLLDFLGDYALSHFEMEERLMERHAYPAAESHRAAHAGFVGAFGRIRYDFDLDGLTEGMVELITSWLVVWLKGHILEMDRALGRWLVAQGQAEAAHRARGGTWVVPSGALIRVLSVKPGRALDRAGVEPGDLIVAMGGRRVAELGLEKAVASLGAPGAGGLTLTVHPGGDRGRIETRFLPRQAAGGSPSQE
jgi:hemerythrin